MTENTERPNSRSAKSGSVRLFAWGALTLALVLSIVAFVQGLVLESHLRQVQATQAATELRNADRDQRLAALASNALNAPEQGGLAAADAALRAHHDTLILADIERLMQESDARLRMGVAPARVLPAVLAAQKSAQLLTGASAARVQAALQHDVVRFKAVPDTDPTELAAKLNAISMQVDHWHALADAQHAAQGPVAQTSGVHLNPEAGPGVNASWGERLRAWIAAQFGDLVRIQPVQSPQAAQLSVGQQQIVRERIQLQLLTLSQGVLIRDRSLIRTQAQAVDTLINGYLDSAQPGVPEALVFIRQLAANAAAATDLSLEETLAVLHAVPRE